MDIKTINNAILELEEEETNFKNIQELAYLYIVKENLEKSEVDNVTRELNDILPCYTHYINVKRDYQLGRVTDESLVYAMEKVCKEIEEFIETLYFNTEFLKERLKIKRMIENLQKIGE